MYSPWHLGPAAKWGRCRWPCSRGSSLEPLVVASAAAWADACEFMRVGWAPPCGVMVWCIALGSSPAFAGSKMIGEKFPEGGEQIASGQKGNKNSEEMTTDSYGLVKIL